MSAAWPLPTGLGGVVGDALVRAPAVVFGPPGIAFRLVLGTILLAAMIAVAREAIILDVAHLEPQIPLAIAVLILALATAYFLVKRVGAGAAPGNDH